MKQQLQLSLPNPCSQSWAEMTPKRRGRHCQKCDRVVVDFEHSSDRQLLDAIKKYGTSLCGRFNESQLNRPLIPEPIFPRTLDLRAVILGLGILACTPTFGATADHSNFSLTEIVINQSPLPIEDTLRPASEQNVYRINLIDTETREPVSFAKIRILDSSGVTLGGAYSDVDGAAALIVSPEMDSKIASIHITSHDGYAPYTVIWADFKVSVSHTIELTPNLEQMIMIGLIIRPSPAETFDIHNPRPSDTFKRQRPGSRD